MDLDKRNATEKSPEPEGMHFRRPGWRLLLILAVSLMSATMLFFSCTTKLSLPETAMLSMFASGLILFLTVLLIPQRVDIKGTAIRVANFTTFHRWRSFDAHEVIGLSILASATSGFGIGLVATLEPSARRRWKRIDINTMSAMIKGDQDIDSPLFLAFFAAVKSAHPGMKVGNLPYFYRGLLPRA